MPGAVGGINPSDRLGMLKQQLGTYRPDIDGLRAIAVALVVFCHAKFAFFAGGFIGVDVFFTISGFVVAKGLLRDIRQGSFSFSDFYVRRAKRLVPALFTVLIATFVFSVLFLIPDDAMEVAKNIAYATGFASNIYLAKQTGYFDADANHQPLLHTWSLSVEEQFYLVLPVILVALRRVQYARRLAVIALIAFGSLVWAEVARVRGEQSAYFFAQYRAFEFLIGVLLAASYDRLPLVKSIRTTAFWIGLLGILACGVTMGTAPFPGVWALAPCCATALVIVGGAHARGSWILSNHFAVWLGRRSYSLYLWHWPVFFAANRFGFASHFASLVCIGVSLGLAEISYRYVETRFRYAQMSKPVAAATFIAMPMVLAGSLVGIGRSTGNFLPLFPTGFRTVYAQATDADWVGGRGLSCWGQNDVTSADVCSVGAADGKRAVLWGDSHAYQFVYFFDMLGKDYHYSVHDLTRPACPPVENPGVSPGKQLDSDCRGYNAKVMEYLLKSKSIDTVFVAATWASYLGSDSPDARFKPGQMVSEMESTFRKLMASGKTVVLLDDVPAIPENRINCQLYNRLTFGPEQRDCGFPATSTYALRDANRAVIDPVVKAIPSIKILHTFGVTCSDGKCDVSSEGVPLYRNNDATHLNLTGGIAYYKLYQTKRPGEIEKALGANVVEAGARRETPVQPG